MMDKFELKNEHVLLIRKMVVGWSDAEFGAPEIDPKRPYGNGSVHQDMLEILGLTEKKPGIYEFKLFDKEWLLKGEDKYNIYLEGADEDTLTDALDALHKETEQALQVILAAGSFEPGTYEEEDYGSWKPVGA